MDVEMVKCECCGLKEECTLDYITAVKSKFDGKWLCGLCSEAVRDEATRISSSTSTVKKQRNNIEEAVSAHMSFCGKYKKSNPAFRVADGMRQMLRRRSVSDKALLPAASASAAAAAAGSSSVGGTKKYYGRSASAAASAQVGDESAALAAAGFY